MPRKTYGKGIRSRPNAGKSVFGKKKARKASKPVRKAA